jgi:DNA replication and repair protein RecF
LYVKTIHLTDFRNIAHVKLEFDRKGILFFGSNGVGKTNVLEAICFLAYGKSFRTASDTDMIKNGAEFFRIVSDSVCFGKSYKFEAVLDRKGRKYVKVNNRKIDRLSELYRILKIVYFSQEDINLIEGQPKGRRQFFDLAISQNNYDYMTTLRHYQQIVKQRNALLKSEFPDRDKHIWDEQFIKAVVDILKYRANYIRQMNSELIKYYRKIGYHSEEVSIDYRYSHSYDNSSNPHEQLQTELKRVEKEEKRQQRTLIGPHLDDYLFLMNGYPINRFGSHGQKRCFSIALQLAQGTILTNADKDSAILIFDDVLSDLDNDRNQSIINSLGSDNQIFIATPQPQPYHDLKLPFLDLVTKLKK